MSNNIIALTGFKGAYVQYNIAEKKYIDLQWVDFSTIPGNQIYRLSSGFFSSKQSDYSSLQNIDRKPLIDLAITRAETHRKGESIKNQRLAWSIGGTLSFFGTLWGAKTAVDQNQENRELTKFNANRPLSAGVGFSMDIDKLPTSAFRATATEIDKLINLGVAVRSTDSALTVKGITELQFEVKDKLDDSIKNGRDQLSALSQVVLESKNPTGPEATALKKQLVAVRDQIDETRKSIVAQRLLKDIWARGAAIKHGQQVLPAWYSDAIAQTTKQDEALSSAREKVNDLDIQTIATATNLQDKKKDQEISRVGQTITQDSVNVAKRSQELNLQRDQLSGEIKVAETAIKAYDTAFNSAKQMDTKMVSNPNGAGFVVDQERLAELLTQLASAKVAASDGPESIKKAQANLETATKSLADARAEYERKQGLADQQIIAREGSDIRSARTNVFSAETAFNNAKTAVVDAKIKAADAEASLTKAETNLGRVATFSADGKTLIPKVFNSEVGTYATYLENQEKIRLRNLELQKLEIQPSRAGNGGQ
jgi:hypothetical protein